jgi:hypothetical protein
MIGMATNNTFAISLIALRMLATSLFFKALVIVI